MLIGEIFEHGTMLKNGVNAQKLNAPIIISIAGYQLQLQRGTLENVLEIVF